MGTEQLSTHVLPPLCAAEGARSTKSARQRELFLTKAKEGNEMSERYPSRIITRNAVEYIKLGSRRHTATQFGSNRLASHFFEKVVLEELTKIESAH